jgi:hypothetical protein
VPRVEPSKQREGIDIREQAVKKVATYTGLLTFIEDEAVQEVGFSRR